MSDWKLLFDCLGNIQYCLYVIDDYVDVGWQCSWGDLVVGCYLDSQYFIVCRINIWQDMQVDIGWQLWGECVDGLVVFFFQGYYFFVCVGCCYCVLYVVNKMCGLLLYQLLVNFEYWFIFGGVYQKNFYLCLQFDVSEKICFVCVDNVCCVDVFVNFIGVMGYFNVIDGGVYSSFFSSL